VCSRFWPGDDCFHATRRRNEDVIRELGAAFWDCGMQVAPHPAQRFQAVLCPLACLHISRTRYSLCASIDVLRERWQFGASQLRSQRRCALVPYSKYCMRISIIDYLLNRRLPSPIKASSENSLDDQVVGPSCGTYANSKVDLPHRRDVQISHDEELLLLVVQRIEVK
jgi:hypothetical protein